MNPALVRVLCFLLFMAVSAAGVTSAGAIGAQPPAGRHPSRGRKTPTPASITERPAAPAVANGAAAAATPTVAPKSATSAAQVAAPSPTVASRPAKPSAMMVAIDPVTGDLLLPTADQAAELNDSFEAMFGSSTSPTEVMLPDGSVYSYAGRRLAAALFAHIGRSGRVEWGCAPAGASSELTPLERLALRRANPAPAATPVIAPEQ